jgi:adenosylcobinamide-phosphate synthase
MNAFEVLILAIFIDLLLGDPRWFPHPVRIMGFAIERGERILRKLFSPLAGGVILCVSVVGGTYAAVYCLDKLLKAHPAGGVVSAFLLWTTISLRGLAGEGRKVFAFLDEGRLDDARRELRSLVGRDTGRLDENSVRKAVIESLAENASDGIIAPVFFYVLGGLPLAFAYKAVNTLDSMVGYRNPHYILFGRASARLDDIANFIPSRLTGLFLSAGAFLLGLDGRGACKIMLRDGRKHPSPNSGVPMAAMAGALHITLGGPAIYGGTLVGKPFIGEGAIILSEADGKKALRLTFISSLLCSLFLGAGTLL